MKLTGSGDERKNCLHSHIIFLLSKFDVDIKEVLYGQSLLTRNKFELWMASALNALFCCLWNNFLFFCLGLALVKQFKRHVINRILLKLNWTQLSVAIWIFLEELSAGKRLWLKFYIPRRSSWAKCSSKFT